MAAPDHSAFLGGLRPQKPPEAKLRWLRWASRGGLGKRGVSERGPPQREGTRLNEDDKKQSQMEVITAWIVQLDAAVGCGVGFVGVHASLTHGIICMRVCGI